LFMASYHCSDEDWQTFKNERRRQLILLAHFSTRKLWNLNLIAFLKPQRRCRHVKRTR